MTGVPSASPLAAVVVPTHDDAGRLDSCLRALGAQTVRDALQIVVSVDGGPPLPDATASLADIVVEGPRMGPAAARNRGWRVSSGCCVLFTDADCIPCATWAEALIRTLEDGADGVKGAYSGGGPGLIQRLAQAEFEERYRLLSAKGSTDLVDTYSAGFRREALESAGGFDESFPFPDHEDVDLSYRLRAAGADLRFQPAALVAHTHRNTWRGYFRTKASRGRWRVEVVRRHPAMAGGGDYTPRCLRIQLLLAPLAVPALLLTPILPAAGPAWAAAFLLSTLPLAVTALRTDPGIAAAIPAFALWRAAALSSGMLRGIFRGSQRGRRA